MLFSKTCTARVGVLALVGSIVVALSGVGVVTPVCEIPACASVFGFI